MSDPLKAWEVLAESRGLDLWGALNTVYRKRGVVKNMDDINRMQGVHGKIRKSLIRLYGQKYAAASAPIADFMQNANKRDQVKLLFEAKI